MRHRRDRAVALVLSLSVLAVLSTLAITFVQLMALERRSARNHVHQVRSRLAAEAGVQSAIGQLKAHFGTTAYSGPGQAWVMKDAVGTQPDPLTELKDAIHPSFEVGAYAGGGELGGLGYSGELSNTPSGHRVTWATRVVAESSKINVNAGDLSAAPTAGYNAKVAAMLNTLGTAMTRNSAVPSSAVGATLGTRILASRPTGGYTRIEDLRAVLGDAEYDQVRPFVTTDSWIDPATVKPHPVNSEPSADWANKKKIRQTWKLDVEPRAPIDVNTAHHSVLVAALTGLAARTVELNRRKTRTVDTPPISIALAETIATAIVDRRGSVGPFTTWTEWDEFIDFLGTSVTGLGYVTTSTSYTYRVMVADVIRAATNPNSRLNKFAPNREHLFRVDKSDLLDYRTEFTLQPGGVFTVECEGRVTRRGWIASRTLIEAKVRLYSMVRHSSQLQFEGARVSGDTDVMTLPGALADTSRAAHEDGQILPKPSIPTAPGDTTFHWYARGSLDAAIGSPTSPISGVPLYFDVDEFSPQNLFGVGTDQSDLAPDGLLTYYRRDEQFIFDASRNRNLVRGSMEFWVKFDWPADMCDHTYVDLVNVFSPIDDKTSISHSFYIKSGGELYSSIYVWDGTYASKRTPADPFSPQEAGFDVYADLVYRGYQTRGYIGSTKLKWIPGQWHHIAIRWNGITEHDMYVDGVRMSNITTQLVSTYPLTGSSNRYKGKWEVNHLQVGTYLKEKSSGSYPYIKGYLNGLIDDVRLYRTEKFPKGGNLSYTPERYAPHSGTGTWVGEMTVPAGATLGTVSWTEYRPRSIYEIYSNSSGGQRDLVGSSDRPDLHVAVRASSSGTWTEITGAGADGAGGAVSGLSTGTIQYRIRFDDAGLSPYNAVAVLDDITVTYFFAAPQIMSWEVSIR